MDIVMSKMRQLNKWYVIVMICIVFSICSISYFHSSAWIRDNFGLIQAAGFFMEHPKEYAICLVCGSIAKIMVIIMAIIVLDSAVEFILALRDGEFDDEFSTRVHILQFIAKIVILVVGLYFQSKIIVNYWTLLLLILITIFVLWFLVKYIL